MQRNTAFEGTPAPEQQLPTFGYSLIEASPTPPPPPPPPVEPIRPNLTVLTSTTYRISPPPYSPVSNASEDYSTCASATYPPHVFVEGPEASMNKWHSKPGHLRSTRSSKFYARSGRTSTAALPLARATTGRTTGVPRPVIVHPYVRFEATKDDTKRRKMWNHVLEKSLFSSQEISTMSAPHRRTIYIASLEAHINNLHTQLLSHSLYPIPFERLEPYHGLNSKTAKSIVAGLQCDVSDLRLKLLELNRENYSLSMALADRTRIRNAPVETSQGARTNNMLRHSEGSDTYPVPSTGM